MDLNTAILASRAVGHYSTDELREARAVLRRKHTDLELREPIHKHPPYSNYLRMADKIGRYLRSLGIDP